MSSLAPCICKTLPGFNGDSADQRWNGRWIRSFCLRTGRRRCHMVEGAGAIPDPESDHPSRQGAKPSCNEMAIERQGVRNPAFAHHGEAHRIRKREILVVAETHALLLRRTTRARPLGWCVATAARGSPPRPG